MSYLFAPPDTVALPIADSYQRFPVHRVYCVGRNYAEHAREMGHSDREMPFFFLKPADAVLAGSAESPAHMPYPSQTNELHHEVELVVALGQGGHALSPEQAQACVAGYAVGLDMTRRDLQAHAKRLGRPWCTAKGFDHSAPIGPIVAADLLGPLDNARIALTVNGSLRQQGCIADMIWGVAEIISQISHAWTLQPGDLVFTGTPAGVGPVQAGDHLVATVDGLPALHVHIASRPDTPA